MITIEPTQETMADVIRRIFADRPRAEMLRFANHYAIAQCGGALIFSDYSEIEIL